MLSFFAENPVAAVIVACEVGLWVLLGLSMVLRYLAQRRRTSTVVLAGIPLLDLVLVIATAIDLHRGADVSFVHVLAGFYLGSSLAFGPRSCTGPTSGSRTGSPVARHRARRPSTVRNASRASCASGTA